LLNVKLVGATRNQQALEVYYLNVLLAIFDFGGDIRQLSRNFGHPLTGGGASYPKRRETSYKNLAHNKHLFHWLTPKIPLKKNMLLIYDTDCTDPLCQNLHLNISF
jgi:hypothetical protein